jgi:hypothetical protein
MSETPFYKTRRGRDVFDRTMPDLVKQIGQLNELLERLVRQLEAADQEDR